MMMIASQPKWRKSVGLILLGVVIFSGYIFWAETRTIILISEPISLSPEHKDYVLKPNITTTYLVELHLHTVPALTRNVICELGVHLDDNANAPPCDQAPALDVEWKISGVGTILRFDNAQGIFGAPFTGHGLLLSAGQFKALSGEKYILNVSVRRGAQILNRYRPELVVQAKQSYAEAISLGLLPVSGLALIFVVTGIALAFRRRLN